MGGWRWTVRPTGKPRPGCPRRSRLILAGAEDVAVPKRPAPRTGPGRGSGRGVRGLGRGGAREGGASVEPGKEFCDPAVEVLLELLGEGFGAGEVLVEGVHVLPMTLERVMEVRTGAAAGGPDVADHLLLLDPRADLDPRTVAVEVQVAGLEALVVTQAHRVAPSAAVGGPGDQAVGDRPDGGAGGRAVIHPVVGLHVLEDGVEAGAEVARDVGVLERALEEGLAGAAAVLLEIGALAVGELVAEGALVAHGAAPVVGRQDVAVAHQPAPAEHLLHQGPRAVAALHIPVEVDVPGEDIGEDDGDVGRLT